MHGSQQTHGHSEAEESERRGNGDAARSEMYGELAQCEEETLREISKLVAMFAKQMRGSSQVSMDRTDRRREERGCSATAPILLQPCGAKMPPPERYQRRAIPLKKSFEASQ
mmetsp:Transcript_83773/g.224068  ORF Transcript_83773/g.224068 Transcript_83773/m.224068 type:complete len:112 (-) Transcript_83773:15-350(-)